MCDILNFAQASAAATTEAGHASFLLFGCVFFGVMLVSRYAGTETSAVGVSCVFVCVSCRMLRMAEAFWRSGGLAWGYHRHEYSCLRIHSGSIQILQRVDAATARRPPCIQLTARPNPRSDRTGLDPIPSRAQRLSAHWTRKVDNRQFWPGAKATCIQQVG